MRRSWRVAFTIFAAAHLLLACSSSHKSPGSDAGAAGGPIDSGGRGGGSGSGGMSRPSDAGSERVVDGGSDSGAQDATFGKPIDVAPLKGDSFVLDIKRDTTGNAFVLVGDGAVVAPAALPPPLVGCTGCYGGQPPPYVQYSGLRCVRIAAKPSSASTVEVIAAVPAPFFATEARMALLTGGEAIVVWTVAPPAAPAGAVPIGAAEVYAVTYSPQSGWSQSETLATGGITTTEFDVAVGGGPNDDAIAVYKSIDGNDYPIAARRFVHTGWTKEETVAPQSAIVGIPGKGIAVGLDPADKAMVLWNEGSAVRAASSSQPGQWTIASDYVFSNNITVGIPIDYFVASFDKSGDAVAAAYPSANVLLGVPVVAVQVNFFSPSTGWKGAVDAIPLAAASYITTLPRYPPTVGVVTRAGTGASVVVGSTGAYSADAGTYAATLTQNTYDTDAGSWGAAVVVDQYRRPVALGVPSTFADGLPLTLATDANGDLVLAYPAFTSAGLTTVIRVSQGRDVQWSAPRNVGPPGIAADFSAAALTSTDDLVVAGGVHAGSSVESWIETYR